MQRWQKVRVVAAFEFLSTVKRKGYLIATFGMPVFMALYGLLISIPGYFIAQKESEVKVFGVIDRADALGFADGERVERSPIPEEVREMVEATFAGSPVGNLLAEGTTVFRGFDDEERARQALASEDIRAYYLIPEDYLEHGEITLFRRGGNLLGTAMAGDQLRRMLRDRLLAGRLPEEVAARVDSPVAATHSWIVEDDGTTSEFNQIASIARVAIPGAFAMFLFISLMMTNGYLLQATATEKENRVVEVLLSSTNPEEILSGKLLGLGAAGLLQMAVWFSMLLALGLFFAGVLAAWGVQLPWGTLVVALFFFIAAYLFLGSLSLATGSLGGNVKESQQWSAIWTILTVVPFMFMGILIVEPHGLLGRVMTWIPFTSPLTVLLRMSLAPEGIAWWEIGGALLMMVGATWLAIHFGARLFRVGLLLTGSRPKLREIWRQARLSA